MTARSRDSIRHDAQAASLILGSVLVELSIREAFHHTWAEVSKILVVLTLWSAIVLAAIWIGKRHGAFRLEHPERTSLRRWHLAGPVMLGVAIGAWMTVVGETWLAELLHAIPGPLPGPALIIFFLVAGVCLAGATLPGAGWSQLRRSVCAAMVIFVISQPVLAHLRARDLVWPAPEMQSPSAVRIPKVQVFVLLDEMNDKAAEPIIAAMSRSGERVFHRALAPVANATAKVVPTLFTHEKFPDAKPCGLNTTCSGTRTLNFSRIHASRPDIDVVGFYLPYCAIQGLRSCHVEVLPSPVLSWDRWSCALLRRSDMVSIRAGEADKQRCRQMGGKGFSKLVSDVEDRIWQAPVWRDGGVLYAHVPLPHPSGPDPDQGLEAHYAANLARAAQLVGRMAETLRRDWSGDFSLIVFSDHPLRPGMWCGPARYNSTSCLDNEALIDNRVPLLLTGVQPPGFGAINANEDVFRLMRSSVQERH